MRARAPKRVTQPAPAADGKQYVRVGLCFYPALSLDLITASQTNPRKHFDQAELEELAASIKEKGVIQPIVVRSIDCRHNHHQKAHHLTCFEIIAGERRWRASKIAGVPSIPAIERDLDDKAVLEIQVIENLQRVDVHPMDEANGYQQLIDTHGYTTELLAAKIGKSISYVYQRLKLLDLIPELQKDFVENKITAGHAILLARLTEKDQQATIKELWEPFHSPDIEGDVTKVGWSAVSVRTLSGWIHNQLHLELKRAPWDLSRIDLGAGAGSCMACPKRTGSNPALFPDIQNEDICTDRACYKTKLGQFIADKVLTDNAVKITTEWIPARRPKAAYYIGDGAKAINTGKERCEYTRTGVYVDGPSPGTATDVCVAPICKKHGKETNPDSVFQKKSNTTNSLSTKAERDAANQKQILSREIARKSTAAIVNAAFDSSVKIGRLELELIAAAMHCTNNLSVEMSELFLARFKKAKLPKYGSPGQVLTAMRKLNDRELASFISGYLVADGLEINDDAIPDVILKARKIDRKGIEKKIADELQPKPSLQTSAISKSKKKAKGK